MRRSRPRGVMRLAMFDSAARLLLPGLVRPVRDLPQVELRFADVDMTPSQVPGMTADHDLVVTHRDEHAPPFRTDRWEVTHLPREPLDVVLWPRHRLTRRRRPRPVDLVDEPWISPSPGYPVDDVLRSIALRTGPRPTVVQRVNDYGVTEELVAAGLGVALLPRYSNDVRGGRRLVRRELAGVRAARHVAVVSRRGTSARPAVRAVLDALHAEVGEVRER